MTATVTPLSANGQSAVQYARRGWAVFSLHAMAGTTCDCRAIVCSSPAKHPWVMGGFKRATTIEKRVVETWTKRPAANVGIATGAVSGIFVLDVDPRHGGDTSLAALVAQHGPLPPTRSVKTGSGGSHYYFKHPGGTLRNSVKKLGAGLDVRGDGGYVVAPPSNHKSSGTYEWLDERDPVDAPA